MGTVILACEALRAELNLAMKEIGCTYPVRWVESALHADPGKLRLGVQEALSGMEEGVTVLMVYGFCGNGMVGVRPGSRRMVLPLVSDCIPLYLGCVEARNKLGMYTYFFTEGYLDSGHHMLSEHAFYSAKYGEERATRITRAMMAHYREIALIDTGAYDLEKLREKVIPFADMIKLPVRALPGSLEYLTDLLEGRWTPDRFLIIEPGSEVTFEQSLAVGQSQLG